MLKKILIPRRLLRSAFLIMASIAVVVGQLASVSAQDAEPPAQIAMGHSDQVTSVAFSPDGRTALSGS